MSTQVYDQLAGIAACIGTNLAPVSGTENGDAGSVIHGWYWPVT